MALPAVDRVLTRLGYRLALFRVQRREKRPLRAPLERRRVLVVLPTEQPYHEAAIALVRQIELEPDRVTLVWSGEEAPELPEEYADRRYRLVPDDLTMLGLPDRATREALHEPYPDVSIDLTAGFSMPQASLVGLSPATYRIGLYSSEAEPFRDILFRSRSSFESAVNSLRSLLYEFDPPLLPLRPRSTRVFY